MNHDAPINQRGPGRGVGRSLQCDENAHEGFWDPAGASERREERDEGSGRKGDGETAGVGIGRKEMCNKLQRALCTLVLWLQ